MSIVCRLPTEVGPPRAYTIFAPPNGADEIVLAFREMTIDKFDLEVGRGSIRRLIRIFPIREFVFEDPKRPTVDHYHAATCRFLTANKEEMGEYSLCQLYLNAQVTAAGTPCGELTVWPLPAVTERIST